MQLLHTSPLTQSPTPIAMLAPLLLQHFLFQTHICLQLPFLKNAQKMLNVQGMETILILQEIVGKALF